MKRMTAWLMALCMAMTCALPVQAEEPKTVQKDAGFQWVTTAEDEGTEPNDNKTNTGSETQDGSKPDTDSKKESQSDTDTTKTEPGSDTAEKDSDSDTTDQKTEPDAAPKPAEKPENGAENKDEDTQETTSDQKPSEDGMKSPEQNRPEDTTPDADEAVSEEPVSEEGEDKLPKSGQDVSDWNNVCVDTAAEGGIEVVLGNALLDGARTEFTVTVEGDAGGSRSQKASLGTGPDKKTLLFEGLKKGEYTLTITAGGYQDYTQNIRVDGDIKTAVVYTGFVELEGCAYTKKDVHPGAMLTGDATGDGRIDEGDRDAILDAISSGRMDLVDFQYYTNSRASLSDKIPTDSSMTSRLSKDAVRVNYNQEGTQITGNTDDLFRDGGRVGLQNKAGGAITENAPAEIGFNLLSKGADDGKEVEQITLSMNEDTSIDSGVILLEVEGQDAPVELEIKDGQVVSGGRMAAEQAAADSRKTLTLDLGGQVAVKKVTIRITGAGGTGNLVEITKVEFLNDMENRIPEPDMDIPQNLQAEGGNKSFTLTWDAARNITGYEVELEYNGETEYVRTASNRLEVKNFKGSKLKNGETYKARVQSVNGAWTSGYGESIQAVPVISKRPDAPDNLKVTGGMRCLRLRWKDMEDTDSYNVFYKEAGAGTFTKVAGVTSNSYEIKGLKDQTRYEVYVTGVNDLGESNPSIHSEAQTIAVIPAQMPMYGLLNESNGKGKVSAHIVSVTHGRGAMESSPLDTDQKSALGTVDKDFSSYYQVMDWDDGGCYVAPTKGLVFTLDDAYQMNYITFAEAEDIGSFDGASVFYYDKEHPDGTYAENVSVVQRKDANGRRYYAIKLAKPITTNKIRLGFTRYGNLRNIVVAEVNFYRYDSLEDDILALYEDDLHTVLKKEVTQATIDALQRRLDTRDQKSGEYHPERDALQRELDNAKGLLDKGFNDIVEIRPGINGHRDTHLGFSGLNGWQPLGITAAEGEQIVVYVGHDRLRTGAQSALQLISTQYHAEAGAFASVVADLKVGRNEITLPAIQSLACEGGGALYIQYTGNNDNDRYAVRVNGGVREPVLDLYGVTDPQERSKRLCAYVEELETHVAGQESLHKSVHEGAGADSKVNRAYDKQNCILGATDIVLDQMMLSVSGEQILAGLGSGSVQEKAERLNQSLQAMDDMLALFYHHKGLSDAADAPATDRMPARHLNIRYMRMFAGAFMYASGNHIGIEWGSVPGLATASPVQEENGKYVSGRYFGWGIAHEIGHNINQGCYAYAEVTNNYFALLAGTKDSNDTVRFKYPDVYKKVTSNTVGRASNVFTQLAMYWQLHLAYDRGYNYKKYDSYKEQHENLFYARVDSFARDTARAPGSLKLDGGTDQNYMRLACGAAQKDLTEFFMRWGLVPDAETIRYAKQFPKEERALYYLTDDARVYEMTHGTSGSIRGRDVISFGRAQVDEAVPNAVHLNIQCTADPEVILGYEIARYQYENGQPVRQVVGFSTENTYVDYVSTINNRVLTYEVTAVDQFGYRSNAAIVGDVRISHDGSQDKSQWTLSTNLISDSGSEQPEGTEDSPCAPEPVPAIYKVIDNDYKTDSFQGHTDGGDAVIELQLNRVHALCGLKFTSASKAQAVPYKIEVSVDGTNYTTVKQGELKAKSGSQILYFENAQGDSWISTYDAAYVRFTALGARELTLTELDLLGPAGDSVSFGLDEGSTSGAVGILQEEYVFEQSGGEKQTIPAGSLLFMGRYKGNPAYNMVVLYDEQGAVIGGVDEEGALSAEQIILADVPEEGMLGEVSDGIWIYWIRPDSQGAVPSVTGKVRAQLYRVNNALTNEGQRIVSDALPLKMPAALDNILLKDKLETEDKR